MVKGKVGYKGPQNPHRVMGCKTIITSIWMTVVEGEVKDGAAIAQKGGTGEG